MTTSRCIDHQGLEVPRHGDISGCQAAKPGMSPSSGREATSAGVALCRQRHQTRTGQPFSGSNAIRNSHQLWLNFTLRGHVFKKSHDRFTAAIRV
jgi:hypothetical protein